MSRENSPAERDKKAIDNAVALANQNAQRIDALEGRVKAIDDLLASALAAGLRVA